MTPPSNGDRALVQHVEELNRSLASVATDLVDVSVALVVLNVQTGDRGDGPVAGALKTTHGALDEIQTAQRSLFAILEEVRTRVATS